MTQSSPPRDLRVLLLEDNPDDALLLEHELNREGLRLHVEQVDSKEAFLARLGPETDLILSDHALPGFNALEALDLVQEQGLDVPFIIVSGAISEETAVEAMRRGASDYVLKDRMARLGQAVRNALQEREHRREKARAEAQVRQRELLNQAVLASLPAAIAVLDRTGCILSANQAWEAAGHVANRMPLVHTEVGQSYITTCRKAANAGDLSAQQALAGLDEVLSGRRSQFTLTYPGTPAEARLWFEMRVVPLVGEQAGGAVLAHSDISEHKRAEEALRESEERWRVLFETNPEAIFISANGLIEYANPAFGRLVGILDVDDLIGRTVIEFVDVHEQDRMAMWFQQLREGKAMPPAEFAMRGRGGQLRDVEAYSVPITFQGRRVKQTVVRDLTERKHYEQQLIEAKDRAEEMSRLKSTFLTNMSHEIRTPLTSILGFAEVLADVVSEETREFAQMIRRSGTRLMETLNSVLDLAQLEGRSLRIHLEPIDLTRQAREALALASPNLTESRLAGEAQLPEAPVYVLADRPGLDRVLANLLSNAIKFTPSGSITVVVEEEEGRGVVRVRDTGVGIGSNFLPHLFNEFAQESTGLGRSFEGSGLGLAISRRLVELMKGSIEVESEKGKGSMFTVRLPLANAPQVDTAAPEARRRAPARSGRRVLLVEDNDETRELVRHLLQPTYEIITAASSQEALRMIRGERFDAVILDEHLGGEVRGRDVLRVLRALPEHRQVPVIACTAYALPGDAEQFLAEGFDAYLPKPFTTNELLATLHGALSSGPGEA